MKKITRTLIDYHVRYIPVKIVDGTAVSGEEETYNFVSEKNLSDGELRAELGKNISTSFVVLDVSAVPMVFAMRLDEFCAQAEKREVK